MSPIKWHTSFQDDAADGHRGKHVPNAMKDGVECIATACLAHRAGNKREDGQCEPRKSAPRPKAHDTDTGDERGAADVGQDEALQPRHAVEARATSRLTVAVEPTAA